MAAKYRYRAVKDGTLSSPYRFIRKGEIVTSDDPINASWLVDAKKAVLDEARPVFGGMKHAQVKAGIIPPPDKPRNTGRHPIADPHFERSLADAKRVLNNQTDDTGTGAQDVN